MRGSAYSAEVRTADKYDLRSEGVLNNKSVNQFMEWCENTEREREWRGKEKI